MLLWLFNFTLSETLKNELLIPTESSSESKTVGIIPEFHINGSRVGLGLGKHFLEVDNLGCRRRFGHRLVRFFFKGIAKILVLILNLVEINWYVIIKQTKNISCAYNTNLIYEPPKFLNSRLVVSDNLVSSVTAAVRFSDFGLKYIRLVIYQEARPKGTID